MKVIKVSSYRRARELAPKAAHLVKVKGGWAAYSTYEEFKKAKENKK